MGRMPNPILKLATIFLLAVACTSKEGRHPRHIKNNVEPELGSEETESVFWRKKAQEALINKLSTQVNVNQAKNVILFIGDGMSIPTLTAARIYQSEKGGLRFGEGSSLFFEQFPYTGLSKTYCVDLKVPDSACSSTAYMGGVKGNEGTIGVNAKVARGDCNAMRDPNNHVTSIAQWFQDAGRATGIVTTTRVTHASPAGAYAHIAERDWEDDHDIHHDGEDTDLCDDIAEQLILAEPGKNLNVIMGGGRRGFLTESDGGERRDGKNLLSTWKNNKAAKNESFAYVSTRDDLINLNFTPTHLLGLFDKSHLDYSLEKNSDHPSLTEMTRKAIEVLENIGKGYFLFVEGGKIDFAHHDNMAHLALDETVEFAKAVAAAKHMTNESDTLIVVTADHAHTMSLSGYPPRATSIFGVGGEGEDDLPYSILSYANGPSYKKPKRNKRPDISNDDMDDDEYAFPSAAPLSSETHGGDDVAVFANGPWAHLFTGSFEENYLPHAMAFASCVGSGKTTCQ